MKRHGQTVNRNRTEFQRIILLCIFCGAGMFFGCIAARHIAEETSQQLQLYLRTFMELDRTVMDGVSFLRAAAVYFRHLLWLLLLSFSAVGIYCIPAVFLFFGFRLAFAVVLFSRCVDGGILVALSLFAVRSCFVLPTMLYFGCTAVQKVSDSRNGQSPVFWRRFSICAFVLLLGTVLEVTVVPILFSIVN